MQAINSNRIPISVFVLVYALGCQVGYCGDSVAIPTVGNEAGSDVDASEILRLDCTGTEVFKEMVGTKVKDAREKPVRISINVNRSTLRFDFDGASLMYLAERPEQVFHETQDGWRFSHLQELSNGWKTAYGLDINRYTGHLSLFSWIGNLGSNMTTTDASAECKEVSTRKF